MAVFLLIRMKPHMRGRALALFVYFARQRSCWSKIFIMNHCKVTVIVLMFDIVAPSHESSRSKSPRMSHPLSEGSSTAREFLALRGGGPYKRGQSRSSPHCSEFANYTCCVEQIYSVINDASTETCQQYWEQFPVNFLLGALLSHTENELEVSLSGVPVTCWAEIILRAKVDLDSGYNCWGWGGGLMTVTLQWFIINILLQQLRCLAKYTIISHCSVTVIVLVQIRTLSWGQLLGKFLYNS